MGNAQSQLSSEENQHRQSCYSACFSRMLSGQAEKKKALQQQDALGERKSAGDDAAKLGTHETHTNEDSVAAERKLTPLEQCDEINDHVGKYADLGNPPTEGSSVAAKNWPIESSPPSHTPAIPTDVKVSEAVDRPPAAPLSSGLYQGASQLRTNKMPPPPPRIPPPPPSTPPPLNASYTLPHARTRTNRSRRLSTSTLSRSPSANTLPHIQLPHTPSHKPSSQNLPQIPSANKLPYTQPSHTLPRATSLNALTEAPLPLPTVVCPPSLPHSGPFIQSTDTNARHVSNGSYIIPTNQASHGYVDNSIHSVTGSSISDKAMAIRSVDESNDAAQNHDIPKKAQMINTMEKEKSVEYEDAEIYYCAPTSTGIQNNDEKCSNAGSCTQSSMSEEPVMYSKIRSCQSQSAQDSKVCAARTAPHSHSSTSLLSRNGSKLLESVSALRAALDSTSDFLSNNFGQQLSICNQEPSTCDQQTNTFEHWTYQPESIVALRTFLESTFDSQNSTPEPQTDTTDSTNNNTSLFLNSPSPLGTVSALCAFLDSISGNEDSETELNEDHLEMGSVQSASTLSEEHTSSTQWRYQAMPSCIPVSNISFIGTDDDYSECGEMAGPSTEQNGETDPRNPSMDKTFVHNNYTTVSLEHNWQGKPPSSTLGSSIVIMVSDYEQNVVQSFCTVPLTPQTLVPISTPSPPHNPSTPHNPLQNSCFQVGSPFNDSDHTTYCAETVRNPDSYGTTTSREVSGEQEDEEIPDEQQVDDEIYFPTGSDMSNSTTLTPVEDTDDDYEDIHSDTDNSVNDSALGESIICEHHGTDQLQQDSYRLNDTGSVSSQTSETRSITCDDLQNLSQEQSRTSRISHHVTLSTQRLQSPCKGVLPPANMNTSSLHMESQPSASQPNHWLVSPTA